MVDAKIVEFENKKFGVVKTKKRLGVFTYLTGDFYDLGKSHGTWSTRENVKEFCIGTFDQALSKYLALVSKSMLAKLENNVTKIKRKI